MNNIYKQLTNVDIEQQKRIWDDRGKGYYGEYLVFCELYKRLEGNCKILMNVNIPTENNKTTELDLVLIHETGIYVFEIKHYKGTIYGNDFDETWTQYFRTTKNNVFHNPILQNAYHINALLNMFKDIPIYSVIVFTNDGCEIKVKNSNPYIKICKLNNVYNILKTNFKNSLVKNSMEKIEEIFVELSKYSQMQETVLYDGKEESFISWLQPTLEKFEEEKNNFIKQKKHTKETTIKAIIINTIIIIGCIIWISLSLNAIKENYDNELTRITTNYNNDLRVIENNYNTELEKFKQNFKHVDEINNEYIKRLNEYFTVSEVSLNNIASDTVTFSAKISRANDIYGLLLTEQSKYIVITSNGKVYEYDVFGKRLSYNKYNNMVGKGIRDFGKLAQIQFFGIKKEDITYIKITNITLFKLDPSRTTIKESLELELYSK